MTIAYVGWIGPSARQELAGDKKEHTFTVSNGTIKVDSKLQEVQADTATDVLMQYALMRRALAFDQANLIEFTKFMKWSDRLMKAGLDKPPPGFQRPSIKQLMAADTKLFEEMVDLTRQGITPKGRPLNLVLDQCMAMHEVAMLIQPRQFSRSESTYEKVKGGGSRGGPSPYSKGKGKGKGKSKSKGPNVFTRMPHELIGCNPRSRKVKIFVSPSIWDDVMGKLTKDVVPGVCMFVVCSTMRWSSCSYYLREVAVEERQKLK